MITQKTTFIYALCEPGSGEVRYIGKSDNPKRRLAVHCSDFTDKDTYRVRWLKALHIRGFKPEMVILCEVPLGGWQDAEKLQIRLAQMSGCRLVNLSPGGYSGASGQVVSMETRAKLSKALSGRIRSSKHIENMAEANRRRSACPLVKAKLRSALSGRVISQETRMKMSAARKGVKFSDAHRAGIRAALLRYYQSKRGVDG